MLITCLKLMVPSYHKSPPNYLPNRELPTNLPIKPIIARVDGRIRFRPVPRTARAYP